MYQTKGFWIGGIIPLLFLTVIFASRVFAQDLESFRDQEVVDSNLPDSINSVDSDKSQNDAALLADQQSHLLRAKDVSLNKKQEELNVKIGNCLSGDVFEVGFGISNKLGFQFHVREYSASCGCVSYRPRDLQIPDQTCGMIFVKIAVPKQAGEFSRVIELADPNRDVRVKISISGNAIAPVIWKSLTNRVSKEGLSKFELQGRVTPEFMERYPGASLSFEFNSPILQDVEVLNPDSGLQTVYLTANTSRIDFNEHVVSGIARVGCQFSI